MKIAIVENNKGNADYLYSEITKAFPMFEVLEPVPSCEEAIVLLEQPDIALALLDIELNDGTSFDIIDYFIEQYQEVPFPFLFVTGYGERHQGEFMKKYLTIDKCLTCIPKDEKDELFNAIEQVKAKISFNMPIINSNNELEEKPNFFIRDGLEILNAQRARVLLVGKKADQENNLYRCAKLSDIVYLEGGGKGTGESGSNYTVFYLATGEENQPLEKLLLSGNLGFFWERYQLENKYFVRISRSHIVNTEYVHSFSIRAKENMRVILNTQAHVTKSAKIELEGTKSWINSLKKAFGEMV